MILRKVVEYYVFFICAKSRHCSWKSTRDIFVYVCFSVFVHVNCATDLKQLNVCRSLRTKYNYLESLIALFWDISVNFQQFLYYP